MHHEILSSNKNGENFNVFLVSLPQMMWKCQKLRKTNITAISDVIEFGGYFFCIPKKMSYEFDYSHDYFLCKLKRAGLLCDCTTWPSNCMNSPCNCMYLKWMHEKSDHQVVKYVPFNGFFMHNEISGRNKNGEEYNVFQLLKWCIRVQKRDR